MARYGIAIDTDLCMACYNCFMACKDEHCGFSTSVSAAQPHTGHKWIRVDSKERGNDNRRIKISNVSTPCLHCKDAPCKKASENGAVYTRPDGIVIIDPEKAKGQAQIVSACPINAIFWNDELELPQKCTMCAHLLDEGYDMPRCVEACPNAAMIFGDLDDPNSDISVFIRQRRVTPLENAVGLDVSVVHLNIPTVFAAGSVYLPSDDAAEGVEVILKDTETGDILVTHTNYFGDWEFDWLEKGAEYELVINIEGFVRIELRFTADSDRYLGEFILSPDSVK